jgi:hypothetical protein
MPTLLQASQIYSNGLVRDLGILILMSLALCCPGRGLPQVDRRVAEKVQSSAMEGVGPAGIQNETIPISPNAATWPFWRLIGVLLLGGGANALRLWHKFRRFRTLGIFTNVWASLYIFVGMVLCLTFHFLGDYIFTSHKFRAGTELSLAIPWCVDSLGVLVSLIAPLWTRKPKAHSQSTEQVDNLGVGLSLNVGYAFIEERVQDRIKERLHQWAKSSANVYSWDVIERAAERTLGLEMNFSSSKGNVFKDQIGMIKSRARKASVERGPAERYNCLVRVLVHCEFRHFSRHLEEAKTEVNHEVS